VITSNCCSQQTVNANRHAFHSRPAARRTDGLRARIISLYTCTKSCMCCNHEAATSERTQT